MTIGAEGARLDRARVVASSNLEVALAVIGTAAEDLEYAPEIMIEGPMGGAEGLRVYVRARAIAMADATPLRGDVTVIGEAGVRATVVVASEALIDARTDVAFAEERPDLAGVYEGYVRLDQAGAGASAAQGGLRYERKLGGRLRAKVFASSAGRGVIVLEDPMHLLHPEGRWVGEVFTGPSARVVLPAHDVLGPLQQAGGLVHVIASPDEAPLSEDPADAAWRGNLSFSATLWFEGLSSGRVRPFARWSVGLYRAGDLPAGEVAPEVDSAAVLAADPALTAATPFEGTEAAVYGALGDVASLPSARDRALMARLRGGELPSIQDCNTRLSGSDAFGRSVRRDALSVGWTTFDGENVTFGYRDGALDYYPPDCPPSICAQSNLDDLSNPANSFPPIVAAPAAATSGYSRTTRISGLQVTFDDPADFYGTSDGRALRGAVPCALDLGPNGTVTANTLTLALAGTTADVCSAMSTSFACTPVDVTDTPASDRVLGLGMRLNNLSVRLEQSVVTRVCAFSELPPRCGEGLVCDRSGTLDRVPLDSAQVDLRSGDLLCAGASTGVGLPMDSTTADADALLAACALDAEGVLADRAPVNVGTGRAGLDGLGWADDSGCLSPLRFLTVLGALTDPARTLGSAPDRFEDALAGRLLNRWLAVHTHIASEAVESAPLAGDGSEETSLDVLERDLSASVRGWQLLLHPRVASALLDLSPSALADPDYRLRRMAGAPPVQPYWTHGRGLVLGMVTLMEAQAELLSEVADRSALAGSRQVPASVRSALRTLVVVDALLAALLDRAEQDPHASASTWREPLRARLARVAAARARFMSRLDNLLTGANPLGIEDADLPLYFQEIRRDAGGRFQALSDYLLGTGIPASGVVPPIVASAASAFSAARTSYLAEAEREVNADNNAVALERRIIDAAYDSGVELQDLCGVEAFVDADGQPIAAEEILDAIPEGADLSRCWFRAERPECLRKTSIDPANFETGANMDASRAPEFALCVAGLLKTPRDYAYSYRHAAWGLDVVWGVTYDVPGPAYAHGYLQGMVQDIIGGDAVGAFGPEIEDRWLNWTGPTETVRRTYEAPLCYPDGNGDELCLGPDFEREVLSIPDDVNPCINDRYPDYAGFLPEVEIDDSVEPPAISLRCRAKAPYAGPDLVRPFDAERLSRPDNENIPNRTYAAAVRYCRDQAAPGDAPAFIRQVEQVPRECYTGSLGAQALAVKSLVTAVDVVRQEGVDKLDEYEINMDSCFALRAGNADLAEALLQHNDAVFAKLDAKLGWDIAAHWAGNTADCLDSFVGAEKPWEFGLASGSCAARALEATFSTISMALENDIEHLDREHELTMLSIESATDEQRCEIEAELALVGARTNALETIQAMEEVLSAFRDLELAREGVNLAVFRGRGDVAWAAESGVRTVGRDPWLNQDVTTFRDKMRLARRAAYLAVRGVEYEFQASLGQRAEVLTADTPAELEAVLDSLRQISSTQGLNGARPTELTEVFSLRQHLLQLVDRSTEPVPGAHALTDVERFRAYITAPRFAEVKDGQLVGYRIPFEIAPLARLGRGVSRGVPIISANSCAERLWSMNVTLQGDPTRLVRGLVPQVNLEVRQQNAFYANWCDEDGRDTSFQQASVRPSRNLFREPGVADGFDPTSGQNEVDAFAKGRVQALLNVPIQDFLLDDYQDGATTELAARLLFGKYELFIPATSVAEVDDTGAPTSDGLVVSELDDILLRLDYLSVAR